MIKKINSVEELKGDDIDMICHENVEAYSYDLEDYSDAASEISDEELRLFLRGVLPPQDFIDGPPDILPCGHCCQNCH